MASPKGLAGVAAVAVLFHCALAASISVGGPRGTWDQTTDLATWAASQKFTVGDSLVFQYTTLHDVLEVTKTDFDNCNTGNPIKTHTGGNTAIALSATGKRHFICGTGGHCTGGMKLEVDVVTASSSAPPRASPPPPTASPAPPKASPPPPTASPALPKASPMPPTAPPAASPATPPPTSAPSPRPRKNSPPPSGVVPEPTAPAQPSDLPPRSAPTSPGPTGFAPQPSPSAAGGLIKASAAAAFVCGLLMLLAL